MLKKIFNIHEETTSMRLSDVCQRYAAQAHPKMRVADILHITNSGISDEEYSYALKAHFDFIVCDKNHMPQFAVEFDGPTHQDAVQQVRDEIKNRLCERFDLPLLRINSKHLPRKYREYDLLSWLVETWFMSKEFYQAQEAGLVSWDEPFDPMMFINMPGKSSRFPMWLSAEVRVQVQKLKEKGAITGRIISHWIGVDSDKTYHGISWVRVSDEVAVMAETKMRKQHFPISESDLLSEILCFQAYDQLEQYLNGTNPGVQFSVVMDRVKHYANMLDERSFAGSGGEHPRDN